MTGPYWTDGRVTLYHGDCREVTAWLAADVLICDPPYGRGWSSGAGLKNGDGQGLSRHNAGIAGDEDMTVRDGILALWGDRPAMVFGDPLIGRPETAVQALVYAKPPDAGVRGARGGFRRDAELIYLTGPWPAGIGGMSSVLRTNGLVAGPRGIATRSGHPHAKPVDVMERLIAACPPGVVADPTSGAGATLIAARNQGRPAIGVELEERWCESAAKRLDQSVLFGGAA